MGMFLGFDPGGAGAFGWCVAQGAAFPLRLIERGIATHADQAVREALTVVGNNPIDGAGIDAPLFWKRDGDRLVDRWLRTQIMRLGASGGTVNATNSMRGACLVQGITAGSLLREARGPEIRLTESHPKAVLWLLGVATRQTPPEVIPLSQLESLISGNTQGATDHERDAAIGALSAFAMTNPVQGWHDLFPLETNPLLPLSAPIGYWMPVQRPSDTTNKLS